MYEHEILLQLSMFLAYLMKQISGESAECHEQTGNSIETMVMSGHFGRDRTVDFVNSHESCHCVKTGNKQVSSGTLSNHEPN